MPPELETSYSVDQPPPEPPQSDIAAISELLSAGDSPEPEQQDAPEAPQGDDQQQETAEQGEQELAPQDDADEASEAQQVDYDQVITIDLGTGGDTKQVTVGELKDFYQGHDELQTERDTWEVQQGEQQLQLMAARRQLVALADMLKDVKPEVMDHVQGMMQRKDEQEAMLLLQTFPAWSDPDKKAAARAEQLATAKEYGFSEWEYSGVNDHRLIKVLHDLAQYRKREAAGKAKREQIKAEKPPKAQKPVQRKQTPAQERAAMVQRAKRGTNEQKISAISSLINEG